MSRWQADDEDWDDSVSEELTEEAAAWSPTGDAFLAQCPNCREWLYEDTPLCPFCGEYVTPTAGTEWKLKPGWYIALAVAGMIAVMWVLLLGG